MKKLLILFLFMFISISLPAVWQVGEQITEDYSWTDSNGEDHSIHELVESGKAIVMFWGGYG